jgi:hypothetical protein
MFGVEFNQQSIKINSYSKSFQSVLDSVDKAETMRAGFKKLPATHKLRGLYESNITIPEGSIVLLESQVRVATNCSVTIGDGVTFVCLDGSGLEVNGDFKVNGSSNFGVLFTLVSTNLNSPTPPRWDGIKVRNGNAYIKNVTIENARDGLYIYKSTFQVSGVVFKNCDRALNIRESMVGINLGGGMFGGVNWRDSIKTAPKNIVEDSFFIKCSFGLYTEYEVYQGDYQGGISDLSFNRCYFVKCLNNAIYININQRPVHNLLISDSLFFGNGGSISLGGGGYGFHQGDITIQNNRIYANKSAVALSTFYSNNGVLLFKNNALVQNNGLISFGYQQGSKLGDMIISENLFVNSGGMSVYQRNTPIVDQNLFIGGDGIKLTGGTGYNEQEWLIRSNLFDGITGVVLSTSYHKKIDFNFNIITKIGSGLVIENRSPAPIQAISNSVVGTRITKLIDDLILDQDDDVVYGKVSFIRTAANRLDSSWWSNKRLALKFLNDFDYESPGGVKGVAELGDSIYVFAGYQQIGDTIQGGGWVREGDGLTHSFPLGFSVDSCTTFDSGVYKSGNRSFEISVLPVGSPMIWVNGVSVSKNVRVGGKAEVQITTSFPSGQIFYTLDGSLPGIDSIPYSGPFNLTESAVVQAYALKGDFTQDASSYPLSVQIAPLFNFDIAVLGGGFVDKIPAANQYVQDAVVTIKATANEGWRFSRWEGDVSGAFPERNLAINRNRAVRAIFEPIAKFNLGTLSRGGSVLGGGIYEEGSKVTIAALSNSNWVFLDWVGNFIGNTDQFVWSVDGPASFEARFGTLVTTMSTGSGKVTLDPDLPVYPYGSRVKVTPAPEAGNYLALWGEAGTGQARSEWVLTVTNGAPRITALFRPLASDKAVLTAQSTFGGRVTQAAVDGIYAKGTAVTVNAVADSGYEFLGWSGAASGSVNPVTLTLDASKTVRAEFRRTGVVSYPVALTVTGPGTVRRVPDLGAYESGTEVELVAEPTAGALFGGWSGAVTSSQRRVRVTVSGAVSVGANFKSVYPVATETRGEGQVLLSPPDANYADGSAVALTAKPAEGWGFVQWSGDLTTTTQESALTVDAPKRVVAEFARLGTLTLKSLGQGAIAKTPDAASYLPGTAVSLKATPAAGWKFVRWSGGASGSNAELAVVVGRTEAIVAEFADGEAPMLTLTEPVSGSVTDERFALKGSVSDNLRLASVTWTWNGVSQGAVPMGDGVFSIDELALNPGTNQIVMEALDAAGNSTRVERVVVWTPVRSLVVKAAAEVQEGQRLVFPVTIDSPGDVAGLTFQLAYDPVWLTDPQWEWGALVGQSVNTLNTATNGQVWATFSMPGQALPLGVQPVATLSFRARSVPELREVELKSSIRSVSGLQGNALSVGNAALAGKGRIKPRRLKADNNANQRLDIGDAVVVARLQVGLEETRGWDVGLNDLNSSGSLDNGDVVKVLRAVVGLDPQPSPGSEGKRLSNALGLAKVLVNTNDAMAIELLDGPKATVGQPYRVAVRLNRVKGSLSGLSFALKYPASLTLTDKQVGALVPGDALPFWNESAGQVSLAAIRSTAWANATGVAAVLTFVPSAGFSAQAEWPLKLEQVEITGSGFDVRPVDPVSVAIQSGGGTVNTPPKIALQPPSADGSLTLEIRAPQGATVAIEATGDLNTWIESQRITGQGDTTPVKITLNPDPGIQARFWRLRVR